MEEFNEALRISNRRLSPDALDRGVEETRDKISTSFRNWNAFLRKLARRGLGGVKLVVSDAHEGLKAAVAKVLSATWQRCRVHFMRNALAHAGRSGRRVVSVFIATAFA